MTTFEESKLYSVLKHCLSLHEADAALDMVQNDDYNSRDIIDYIDWCESRYNEDLPTEFDIWLEERKPRVTIGFCVTECGLPVSGTLEFPKRGEDMEKGTEFEWYYSLREITDKIMALEVGQSIPFKIRDDQASVGSVTRLK